MQRIEGLPQSTHTLMHTCCSLCVCVCVSVANTVFVEIVATLTKHFRFRLPLRSRLATWWQLQLELPRCTHDQRDKRNRTEFLPFLLLLQFAKEILLLFVYVATRSVLRVARVADTRKTRAATLENR